NSIHSNGLLGISGPRDGHPQPLLALARSNGTQVTIAGSLTAAASSHYRIELFTNSEQDPSGHGEGAHYLGHVKVTTDATGRASFGAVFTTLVAAGDFISATATRADAGFGSHGASSEFARNIAV